MYGTTDYIMELGNLSRSGALLTFGSLGKPLWARLGNQVQVGIVNPQTLDTVQLVGEIVRTHQDADGHGFAVRFQEPDEAAAAGLDELVRLAARREAKPPRPSKPRRGPPPLPQEPDGGPPRTPGGLPPVPTK